MEEAEGWGWGRDGVGMGQGWGGHGTGTGCAGEELAGKSLEKQAGQGSPLGGQPAVLRNMDFTRRQLALTA